VAARRPNHRLVKIHRNYDVTEVVRLFGIHRNTVKNWIKDGLPILDCRRPILILGTHLAAYLCAKRARRKRKCESGQIYCMRCRAPVHPAGRMADLEPRTEKTADLIGICPDCYGLVYRRISLAKLDLVRGNLDVSWRRVCNT